MVLHLSWLEKMKEPDPDAGTEVRSRASKRKSEASVKDKPLTLRRQGPLGSTPVVAPREGSFGKTPGCPACSSGMVAPGIRHSAVCRPRLQEFERGTKVRTALDAAVSDEERQERASSFGRRTTFWRRTSSKSCP